METKKMKLSDIIPADYNPRIALQEGSTEFEALKKSISRFGLVDPLIVNKRSGILIGGHQRLNVLKSSGVTETEVILLDLDEEDEKTLNVALNKIEGDWEFDKLAETLKELNSDDLSFTGFSEEDVRNIIGIEEEESSDVLDELEKENEQAEEGGDYSNRQRVLYVHFLRFERRG